MLTPYDPTAGLYPRPRCVVPDGIARTQYQSPAHRPRSGRTNRAHAIQVLKVTDTGIARIVAFARHALAQAAALRLGPVAQEQVIKLVKWIDTERYRRPPTRDHSGGGCAGTR